MHLVSIYHLSVTVFVRLRATGCSDENVPSFFSPASQVASSPAARVEEKEATSPPPAGGDAEGGPVCFVLEERSGYMEPSLRLLAVAHTVISFFCIFGYYCLKVPRARSQPLEVFSRIQINFRSTHKRGGIAPTGTAGDLQA